MIAIATFGRRFEPKSCEEILMNYRPRQVVASEREIPASPIKHFVRLIMSLFPIFLVALIWVLVGLTGSRNHEIGWQAFWPILQTAFFIVALGYVMLIAAIVLYRSYWAKRLHCSYFEIGYLLESYYLDVCYIKEDWFQEIAVDVIRSARRLDECGELISKLKRVLATPLTTGVDQLGENRADIERIIEELRATHPTLARI